jgi:hypothetical protein
MAKEIITEFEEIKLESGIVKGVQVKRRTLSEIYEPQPDEAEETNEGDENG